MTDPSFLEHVQKEYDEAEKQVKDLEDILNTGTIKNRPITPREKKTFTDLVEMSKAYMETLTLFMDRFKSYVT